MAPKSAAQPQTIGEFIDITLLYPSPTNPRRRFYESSLDELAGSIQAKGVIEPIIVRKNPNDAGEYEIVCGERRYKASTIAEQAKVPCIIRELSDDEVIDIQIHENLHREDVHPMDEAYGYQMLKDKLGCDNAEVAARVGKSEKFVASRLKLNSLIEEAQEDIEKGHLPLVYALEITKFPAEIQTVILEKGTYHQDSNWDSKKREHVYFPVKDRIKPWSDFLLFIRKNILGLLSAAPFDVKATNLRDDNLACIACPDRTGANAGLFEEDAVDKKDSCLNPVCFHGKAERLVKITRERVAHEATVEPTKIPLINLDSYSDRGEILSKNSFILVAKKKPFKDYYGQVSEKTCDKSTIAVNVGDGQFAKTYQVCLPSSGCKVHFGRTTSSRSSGSGHSAADQEAELQKKRERREELVDVKIGNEVRARVFRIAMETFNDAFTITGGGKNLMPLALAKMWTHNGSDDGHTKNRIIRPILAAAMDVKEDEISFGSWDRDDAVQSIAKLTPANQNRLFFLLVHGNSGAMYWDNAKSQKVVRDLADEYGIDYRLLDAEERLKWAEEKAKKHVPAFKLYLDAVRAGDAKATIPRPYAETYNPKD